LKFICRTRESNASSGEKSNFFDKASEEVNNIFNDEDNARYLRLLVNDDIDRERFKKFHDRFYDISIPNNIEEDKKIYYVLLYQSIRCVALLHDVGHFPFSHVTENAMEECYELYKSFPQEMNDRQKEFLEEMDKLYKLEGDKLHEKLGLRISERLFEYIIKNEINETEEKLFFSLVWFFAKKIFREENIFFKDLHKIVDGAIDSDRLDYVTRDIKNSGLGGGKLEYDRIIPTVKLVKKEENYLFCFDTRTLSSIEELFYRRQRLYKYIIYHHRVIKTDYLLQKILVQLINKYLEQSKEVLDDEEGLFQSLQLEISGLWKATNVLTSDSSFFNSIVQWDDSWLISVLRYEYFKNYKDIDEPINYQLEELLSNRKNYISIIKRMDDVFEIDDGLVNLLEERFYSNLKAIFDKKLQKVEEFRSDIERYKQNKSKDIIIEKGFFLTRLRGLFNIMEELSEETLPLNFGDIVNNALNNISEEFNIKDFMVVFKDLKTGLEAPPNLRKDSTILFLTEVSRIDKNLYQDKKIFPPLFIYCLSDTEINKVDYRKRVGEAIASELQKVLNNNDEIVE